MRELRILSATLLLLAAPAFAGGGRDSKPTRRAAAHLAKLFPGSKVVEDDSKGWVVLPIKRRGLRGYGKSAHTVNVPGGSLLVFELTLAKMKKEEVRHFAFPGEAGSSATGPSSIKTVVGMILLDEKGTFRAKPEGWPKEAEQSLECMGDFCATGVWIRNLVITRGDGSQGLLTLDEAGYYKRYPYQIKEGKLMLGLPTQVGSVMADDEGDEEDEEVSAAAPAAKGNLIERPDPQELEEAKVTPFGKNEKPWSGVSPPYGPRHVTSGQVVHYDDNYDDAYLIVSVASGQNVAFLINTAASPRLQKFTETANEQKGKKITLIWRFVDSRPEGDPEMLQKSRLALDLR